MNHVKQSLGYREYGAMMERLTRLVGERAPTHVFGPPRGGLPIAVHLSHHLDIPMLTEDEVFGKRWDGGDLLCLADDIVDTGVTFARLVNLLESEEVPYVTAALLVKPHAGILPHIHLGETTRWIIFPWEHPDETPNR